MPTGYTADIEKGISFEQFALQCARAFGALIMMRDEATDAPIPAQFLPSDHSLKTKESLERKLAELQQMNGVAIAKAYRTELGEVFDRMQADKEKRKALLIKYQRMLDRALTWKPPTADHKGLQTFMVDQIRKSIDFDCSSDYSERAYAALKETMPLKWHEDLVTKTRKEIRFYASEYEKEVERVNGRNEWVKALRESLK